MIECDERKKNDSQNQSTRQEHAACECLWLIKQMKLFPPASLAKPNKILVINQQFDWFWLKTNDNGGASSRVFGRSSPRWPEVTRKFFKLNYIFFARALVSRSLVHVFVSLSSYLSSGPLRCSAEQKQCRKCCRRSASDYERCTAHTKSPKAVACHRRHSWTTRELYLKPDLTCCAVSANANQLPGFLQSSRYWW